MADTGGVDWPDEGTKGEVAKSLTDCAELMDEAREADETTDRTSRGLLLDDVRGGMYGRGELIGSVLARIGATIGAHSLAKGLSSTLRISSCSNWQSHAGRETSRLLRTRSSQRTCLAMAV